MTKIKILVFVISILFITIIGFSGCFIMNEGGFVKVKSIDENFEVPQNTTLNIFNYIEGDISIFSANGGKARSGENR